MKSTPVSAPIKYVIGKVKPAPGFDPPFDEYACADINDKLKKSGGFAAVAKQLGLSEQGLRDAADGKELTPWFREAMTVWLRSR